MLFHAKSLVVERDRERCFVQDILFEIFISLMKRSHSSGFDYPRRGGGFSAKFCVRVCRPQFQTCTVLFALTNLCEYGTLG